MEVRCAKTHTTLKVRTESPQEFCSAMGLVFNRKLDEHFFEAEDAGVKYLFEIITNEKGSILC